MAIQVSFSSSYSSDIAVFHSPHFWKTGWKQCDKRELLCGPTIIKHCNTSDKLALLHVNAGHQLHNSIHIFDKQTTTNKLNIAHHVRNVTKWKPNKCQVFNPNPGFEQFIVCIHTEVGCVLVLLKRMKYDGQRR